MLKQLPNALTLTRLILAPVIAWLFWRALEVPPAPPDFPSFAQATADLSAAAAILFIIAALTDLFDGMIARALDAHSKFGRIIDPIADKALVGLPLIAAALVFAQHQYPDWLIVVIATMIIVLRDVGMTIFRLASPDGEGVRVSSLAKWKTTLELIVVGLLLLVWATRAQLNLPGSSSADVSLQTGVTMIALAWPWLLALAAALSAWTAFQYLSSKPKA